MQYSVPQFVDVEDKVIGPLSIRQFLYLLGGIGIAITLWVLLPAILAIILDLPIVLLAAGLAFYKINGVPLQTYIANLFAFVVRPNTRVWKREVELDKTITKVTGKKQANKGIKLKLGDVNLSQLTYILDHELAAQARPRPITNNVESLPVPKPQVMLTQDIAVESIETPPSQELSQPAVAEAAQSLPEAPDVSNASPKNPNVITSIRPFRLQK